jgi:RND family efflux transporter MFP subunit
MKKITWSRKTAASIPAILLLLCGCGNNPEKLPEDTPRQVQAALVTNREIPNEINGFGTLSFQKKVDVAAPEDAVLDRLFCREGDRIVKGQRIAVLENPQIRLAVERALNAHSQATAALDLAKSRLQEGKFQAEAQILNLERSLVQLAQARRGLTEQKRKQEQEEALFEAGGLSEEALRNGRFSIESGEEELRLMELELDIQRIGLRDEDLLAAGYVLPNDDRERFQNLVLLSTSTLRAELAAAQAQFEAAGKELESARILEASLTIRSPAGGIVGARYIEEGERLKREDKIITIIDTESLYAIFPVGEAEAFMLEKGMKTLVKIDGTGTSFEGEVELISPQADSQSFTFMVRALLSPHALAANTGASDTPLVKPGMFARISISLGPPRSALVIPETALLNKKNSEGTVFTIKGNTLAERKIRIGGTLGEEREVIDGLDQGEVIAARPDTGLREGLYVKAVN